MHLLDKNAVGIPGCCLCFGYGIGLCCCNCQETWVAVIILSVFEENYELKLLTLPLWANLRHVNEYYLCEVKSFVAGLGWVFV